LPLSSSRRVAPAGGDFASVAAPAVTLEKNGSSEFDAAEPASSMTSANG
jgi:hypothetical protein